MCLLCDIIPIFYQSASLAHVHSNMASLAVLRVEIESLPRPSERSVGRVL